MYPDVKILSRQYDIVPARSTTTIPQHMAHADHCCIRHQHVCGIRHQHVCGIQTRGLQMQTLALFLACPREV